MSFQITTAFKKEYHDNFTHLSQQKKTRLRNTVREESCGGEEAFFDQIGISEGHDITNRHGDTQYADTPHERRRVTMVGWEWADLIDKLDKVATLNDPTSAYVNSAAMSANRRMDKHIIDAARGTAYEGKTGSTAVTLPSTQKIAHGSAGLTLAKLLETKEIFDGNEVDEELERIFCASARQFTNLLNTTEVTSADYASVKALVQGHIDQFLGFTFKRSQQLELDGTTRYCIAYASDGILLAVGEDVVTEIDVLPTKRHATQVRAEMSLGATRMEEEKVVEIACVES